MSTERNRRWFGGAVQTASLSPVHTTAAVGLEKDVNLLAENDTNGNDRTLIVCVFAWHIRNVVLPQQARAHTVLWERRIDYEYIHVRHKRSLLTELLPECPARDDYVRTVPRPSPIQNSHNTSDAGHTNLAPRPTAENLATYISEPFARFYDDSCNGFPIMLQTKMDGYKQHNQQTPTTDLQPAPLKQMP